MTTEQPCKYTWPGSVLSMLNDVLLPTTDAGVGVQLVAITVVFAATVWTLRRRAEYRLLAVGMWLSAYGFVGLRALH